MMVHEASELLLGLHLRHSAEAAKIADLKRSGVSAARIFAIYPLDLREWATSLDLWLADVPPAALKNIHLPVPLDLRDWARFERHRAWAIYRSSAAFDRHLTIAEQLFPKYNFSKEMFLQDLHTALWYLDHWSGSMAECSDKHDVAAMVKYVSLWAEHLMDPAAQGHSRLNTLVEEAAFEVEL